MKVTKVAEKCTYNCVQKNKMQRDILPQVNNSTLAWKTTSTSSCGSFFHSEEVEKACHVLACHKLQFYTENIRVEFLVKEWKHINAYSVRLIQLAHYYHSSFHLHMKKNKRNKLTTQVSHQLCSFNTTKYKPQPIIH